MKLWLAMATTIVFFSGCNSRSQNVKLQNTNAQQSLRIQQQQLQIDALRDALDTKKAKARAKAASMPQAPKKNIKLKKVEDTNYSAGYMYPGATKKKKPIKVVKSAVAKTTVATASTVMGKPECITMIGQAKFDKYTQMFGSEAASIKRCSMLKAMR